MLSRDAKSLFYAAAGPLMALNGLRHRLADRAAPGGVRRVQLGPGQDNYLPGWINCDSNIFSARADRWVDLRNPLPFADASVDAVYSHHMIEHLPDPAAHCREVARILKPGGVYRVGGPDADMAIDRYKAGDLDWFVPFPTARRSGGGRLDNFLFCRGEHVMLVSEGYLTELLEDAGFTTIRRLSPRVTDHSALFADAFQFEEEPDDHPQTVIMEATRGIANPSATRNDRNPQE